MITEISGAFEVEVNGEPQVIQIQATRYSTIITDADYGADADGRRGVSRDFLEDDLVEDVTVDGKLLETLLPAWQEAVHQALQAFMNSNWPEEN